jgi:hypothetical protein
MEIARIREIGLEALLRCSAYHLSCSGLDDIKKIGDSHLPSYGITRPVAGITFYFQ